MNPQHVIIDQISLKVDFVLQRLQELQRTNDALRDKLQEANQTCAELNQQLQASQQERSVLRQRLTLAIEKVSDLLQRTEPVDAQSAEGFAPPTQEQL